MSRADCDKLFTQQERQEHSGDKFYEILYDSILPEISRAFSSLKYDWLRVEYDEEMFRGYVSDMRKEIKKAINREESGFCLEKRMPWNIDGNENQLPDQSKADDAGQPYTSKQLINPSSHPEGFV